ncbi:MAG: hypothetical protein ACJ75B_01075 [Flavisolibacter sp.]
MHHSFFRTVSWLMLIFFFCPNAKGQEGGSPSVLFGSDSVLELRFTGNVRDLFNDRSDKMQYHSLVLSYNTEQGMVSFPIKAKTRGHFRRTSGSCDYPPILLNFTSSKNQSTLFDHQTKLKLVCPCRGENYVIREYLVYRLYNLLTSESYRARLVHVVFRDSIKKKETAFHGFLLEEDEEMAKRNHTRLLKTTNWASENTDTSSFLKMVVFQYLIGNTDWSVPYLHNIRLISKDSLLPPSVVPYDFDHAGIVDAPYALPPEELGLQSVQERRFRGYCIDAKAFDEVVETFNRLKKDLYNVYLNCPLLDAHYLSSTIRYMEQFYTTINDRRRLHQAFSFPCYNSNIIIKGMDKQR